MRKKLLWIALILVLILSCLPALARHWWFADLCSHFRIQSAAFGLLAAATLAWTRRWLPVLLAVAVIVINVTALAPSFTAPEVPAAGPPLLRIVFANVYYRNTHTERVIRLATESDADIIVLAEITPAWSAALAPLNKRFPYRHYAYLQGQRRTGTLLLSRLPLASVTTLGFGRTGDPGVSADVHVGTKVIHVIGVHPTWPLWWISTHNRDAQYARIAELARADGDDTIVIGDFNATPFSPAFQRFLAGARLTDVAQGRGWMPTWPTFFPPFGLQIDHALVSRNLALARFARGPRVGSDHWPIVVDLATLH